MEVVILAGGRGTRMGSETDIMPKPLVTIGGIPILRHIMNYYAKFGETHFIILGGYKIQDIIDYCHTSDIPKNWEVAVVDTGLDTPTGQRLLEVESLITEQQFMLTYGDGLSDVQLPYLNPINYTGVITAVHPPGRFGTLTLSPDSIRVLKFNEKQRLESEWINGGFMKFRKEIFDYIEKDEMLEFDVFPRLAEEKKLLAYKHEGFWQCMDTPRDKEYLEELWKLKRCYWR
jgi:glucose-1-phosphate cytidylyltransferase